MQNRIEKAAKLLSEGKLIVYPTDTLYGLGADISNEDAVKRVYEVKKRSFLQSLSIAVCNVNKIKMFAHLGKTAERIARKFMPGPITLILKKKSAVSDIVAKDKIAVRVPGNNVALSLSRKCPLTATSANRQTIFK